MTDQDQADLAIRALSGVQVCPSCGSQLEAVDDIAIIPEDMDPRARWVCSQEACERCCFTWDMVDLKCLDKLY